MGHPRRLREKFTPPGHPYRQERIEEEKELKHQYGLKNNREVWKAKSAIRKVRAQARQIQADKSEKRQEKEKELMKGIQRIGLVTEESELDDVLALQVNDWLDRRIQTIVFKKGLAKSINQSRQFITHGHIAVNDRKVNVPGYIVKLNEENSINYYGEPPLIEEPTAPETTEPQKTTNSPDTKPKVPEPNSPDTKPKVPETGGDSE